MIFEFYCKKKQKSKIRKSIRAFNFLKNNDQLDIISKIKDELSTTYLCSTKKIFSTYIFGTNSGRVELIARQYLLEKLIGVEFNKSLLEATLHPQKKIFYPLPPEWRSIVNKYGYNAEIWENKIYWLLYILFKFSKANFELCSHLYKNIFSSKDKIIKRKIKYAYFEGLHLNNLPGENSHDIITWYLNWENRSKGIDCIYHNIKSSESISFRNIVVNKSKLPFPSLNSFLLFLKFCTWAINTVLVSICQIFNSNYLYALLFSELIYNKHINLLSKSELALDYLFHNSNHIYRPMWTYEAESKGSRILFYFYSTNCETFKNKIGYPLQEHMWNVISWTNYLVWDKYQYDFIKRHSNVKNQNIQIVGPIWFSSTKVKLPDLNKSKTFVIFDVQPMRDSRYVLLGQSNGFNTPEVTNPFLIDIARIAEKHNFNLIFKRKRDIGILVNKKYSFLVKWLMKKSFFYSTPPDGDAIDLIMQSVGVISMPFTSTAIIAKELNVSSIYYDPINIIEINDRAAHGIKIIKGEIELEKWMLKVTK
jgi:polysaccharide biosynthesis PFTS motif protein